jgi:hypothetical protein
MAIFSAFSPFFECHTVEGSESMRNVSCASRLSLGGASIMTLADASLGLVSPKAANSADSHARRPNELKSQVVVVL